MLAFLSFFCGLSLSRSALIAVCYYALAFALIEGVN